MSDSDDMEREIARLREIGQDELADMLERERPDIGAPPAPPPKRETKTHAIPTLYKGTQFRSRLEAKWAAFFDALGWKWEYEPLDLDGYIPDFILKWKPAMLVEVKGATDHNTLREHIRKIDMSGWAGEFMVVGAVLLESEDDPKIESLGLLAERQRGFGDVLGDAVFFRCTICGRASVAHSTANYACRVSGCHDGKHHRDFSFSARAAWVKAGNAVQWKPTKPKRRR